MVTAISCILFEDGSRYPDLFVHVHVMVDVQVFDPCFSWIFLVVCARVMVGGLLCPGCGLELFDVGLLVVMLGCLMLFRGGVVHLLCSLLWWPFGFVFCPFPCIRGGVSVFRVSGGLAVPYCHWLLLGYCPFWK